MSDDPCTTNSYWSAISAANLDSTVAGVLAGLLIAAAVALLVQSYQGSDSHTVALFGSGVPALALSTYLFTVNAGAKYPDTYPDPLDHTKKLDMKFDQHGSVGDTLCSQLWSEWIIANGSLFIGTAVLVCGLAWALISYADNLAVKLCEANVLYRTIEARRNFFIRLSAWLSSAVITTAIALLVATNIVYLTAIGQSALSVRIFDRQWYVVYVVYLVGLLFIGRSSYVIFARTHSAMRANHKSCVIYARASVKSAKFAWLSEEKLFVAKEIAGVAAVTIAALLAAYMATGEAFNNPRGITIEPAIVFQVVAVYILARGIFLLTVRVAKALVERKSADLADDDALEACEVFREPIRIKYSFGWLSATTYSVVFLAIIGTIFVVGLTQGPLWSPLRITVSLLLGGLYPAAVLTALSSSVPAGEDGGSLLEREPVRELAFAK